MAYAQAIDVPIVLSLQETARVASDAYGDTIELDRPADVQPGSIIAVGYQTSTPDIVSVTAMQGQVCTVSPQLSRKHYAGEKVIDITVFDRFVEAASRLVDAVTNGRPGWMEYGEIAETLWGIADRDGNIAVPVTKRPVKEVLEFRYKTSPSDPEWNAEPRDVWFEQDDYWIRAYPGVIAPTGRRVLCFVRYRGGYAPDEIPTDIRHATAVLAARLWKEKDSGFADVIGAPDIGVIQYKKAVPADILAMLQMWRRVAV